MESRNSNQPESSMNSADRKELDRQIAELNKMLEKSPEELAEDAKWEKRELRNLFINAMANHAENGS